MQQHVDQLLMRWKEDHEKGLLDSKWQTVNAGFNRIQLECIHDEHSPIKNLANNRVKI